MRLHRNIGGFQNDLMSILVLLIVLSINRVHRCSGYPGKPYCNWELQFKDPFHVHHRRHWKIAHQEVCEEEEDALCYHNENVKMDQDLLSLQSKVDIGSKEGTIASSGQIWTTDSYLYGRFVIRAKIPSAENIVSSFSLTAEEEDNEDAEFKSKMILDIATFSGNQTKFVQANVYPPYEQSNISSNSGEVFFPCISDFADDFHEFRLDWDRHWLRWFVDGVLYHEVNIPTKDQWKNTMPYLFGK